LLDTERAFHDITFLITNYFRRRKGVTGYTQKANYKPSQVWSTGGGACPC